MSNRWRHARQLPFNYRFHENHLTMIVRYLHRFLPQPHLHEALLIITIALIAGGCTNDSGVNSTQQWKPEDLSDPSIMPRIIFSNPGTGSVGPYPLYNPGSGRSLPHLILRFNKYINTRTINSSTISVAGFNRPVSVRRFTGDSTASNLYADMLLFSIIDDDPSSDPVPVDYSVGNVYTITIDSRIEDINRNTLGNSAVISYTPEPAFRFVSSFPADGAVQVAISSALEFTFNSPINTNLLESVQFQPPLSGRWSTDPYRLLTIRFQPSTPLPYGNQIAFTIPATMSDVSGRQLGEQKTGSFTIVQFGIVKTVPRDNSVGIWLGVPITITFTGPIDTSTIGAAFSIDPPTAGRILITGPGGFDFLPAIGLQQTTLYTVHVGNAIRSQDGNYTTDKTFTFSTDQFRLVLTNPADGAYHINRTSSVSMEFNSPIDTGSVRGALNISPAVRGSLVLYYGSSGFSFVPETTFAANTLYTVTLTQGIKTMSGSRLASVSSFAFTTTQ